MQLIVRLCAAALFAGVIGAEREARAKGAGVRTHVLVALGSALFMVISQHGFSGMVRYDAARVAAQVVSGIGFIGAGIIIFQKNRVSGLTTAAGLWVTAALGLASGSGMFVAAGAATLISITCLEVMRYYATHWGLKIVTAMLSSTDSTALTGAVRSLKDCTEHYAISKRDGVWHCELVLRVPVKKYGRQLIERLSAFSGVQLERMD